MTEYNNLLKMLSGYEYILHPDVFKPLMKQINKVYEESLEEAFKKANISYEARWLDEELTRLKKEKHREDFNHFSSLMIKVLYKEILKIYL